MMQNPMRLFLILLLPLALWGCASQLELSSGEKIVPFGLAPAVDSGAGTSRIPINEAGVLFERVTGAPPSVASPLIQGLESSGRKSGIKVIPITLPERADYKVTGYLRGVSSRTNATIFYVWEIFDRSGTKVHDIRGSVQTSPVSGDIFSTPQGSAVAEIRTDTLNRLKAWLTPVGG